MKKLSNIDMRAIIGGQLIRCEPFIDCLLICTDFEEIWIEDDGCL